METKEEQWKRLYESAVVICGIYNKQLYSEFQKNKKLEEKNKALYRDEADSECYVLTAKMVLAGTGNSSCVARMKCLTCGEMDLKPIYQYCPNCGRKFK